MALAVVAGAAIGILTQLPVAALLGGIGAFMAPSVIGGRAELEHEMSVIEGIASWAEMLRDTMAAAGGLEQSIIPSATVAPPAIRREVAALPVRVEREWLPIALQEYSTQVADTTSDLVEAQPLSAAATTPNRLAAARAQP